METEFKQKEQKKDIVSVGRKTLSKLSNQLVNCIK